VSHLHIPDGVLSPWVWGAGLAAAVLLLLATARALRGASPQQVAFQGALGALVLAAMAIHVPIGPIGFHLMLVGPLGILLGAASAFQTLFVVGVLLAFLGHGGFTVIGLNVLVLGAGAALARPLFRTAAPRMSPPAAFALATAVAQAASGALWLAVMAAALPLGPAGLNGGASSGRLSTFAAIAFPVWLAGVLIESGVAWGVGRFLHRVRPDLLAAGPARGTELP
jgi:cobalt/nickel transport system permease protein